MRQERSSLLFEASAKFLLLDFIDKNATEFAASFTTAALGRCRQYPVATGGSPARGVSVSPVVVSLAEQLDYLATVCCVMLSEPPPALKVRWAALATVIHTVMPA